MEKENETNEFKELLVSLPYLDSQKSRKGYVSDVTKSQNFLKSDRTAYLIDSRISCIELEATAIPNFGSYSPDSLHLQIPRKCTSSSRIIHAKDKASIQIDIVDVDPKTGRLIPGKSTRWAICGEIRRMGESDDCILRLAQKNGIVPEFK